MKRETDTIVVLITLVESLLAFGLAFFSCEMGQKFSDVYVDVNDIIDEFNWYAFPTEVKRMLPLIIHAAQQPVAIECFGSTMCVRETFQKVSGSKYTIIICLMYKLTHRFCYF